MCLKIWMARLWSPFPEAFYGEIFTFALALACCFCVVLDNFACYDMMKNTEKGTINRSIKRGALDEEKEIPRPKMFPCDFNPLMHERVRCAEAGGAFVIKTILPPATVLPPWLQCERSERKSSTNLSQTERTMFHVISSESSHLPPAFGKCISSSAFCETSEEKRKTLRIWISNLFPSVTKLHDGGEETFLIKKNSQRKRRMKQRRREKIHEAWSEGFRSIMKNQYLMFLT